MREPELAELEQHLGVAFRRHDLLRQALVHRSYLNENPDSGLSDNERLELLGDAALGLIVARWLYDRYPELDEGQLTELRAALVRRETLARLARRLYLGPALRLGRGEEASGGRDRDANLSGALEAVVGALLLERGLARTGPLVRRWLEPELRALGPMPLSGDAKSRLQHLAQLRWGHPPTYRTVAAEGPDHAKLFTVEVCVSTRILGVGRGLSKQLAEKEAARAALEALGPRGGRRR